MIILLLWGCTEQCPDGPSYEAWAEGFFLSKCQPCHAPHAREIFEAPDIELGTHADLLDQLDVIRTSVLETQRMPPGGGLSEDERMLLEQWLDCPQ
jgi:uncharacterized membrane protein